MSTEHQLADILRAIAEGKTIQIGAIDGWSDVDTSIPFSLYPNTTVNYRVKPIPKVKKYKVLFFHLDKHTVCISTLYYSSCGEFDECNKNDKAIQLVESTMIEV